MRPSGTYGRVALLLLLLNVLVGDVAADIFVKRSGHEWVHTLISLRGYVWVLASECIYRIEGDSRERIPLAAYEEAYAIAEVNSELWLGTSKGLFVLDGTMRSPHLTRITRERGVHAILVKDGAVWLGTSGGVIRLEETSLVPPGEPRSIEMLDDEKVGFVGDIEGRVWFGSSSNAYYLEGGRPQPVFEPGFDVKSIKWLAGKIAIIVKGRYSLTLECFQYVGDRPEKMFVGVDVSAIGEINGSIWAGDINGDVYRTDAGSKVVYASLGDSPDGVNALIEHSGEAWVGTSHVLFRRLKSGTAFVKEPFWLDKVGAREFVTLPEGDDSEILWLITTGGVFSLKERVLARGLYGGFGVLPFRIGGRLITFNRRIEFKEASYYKEGGGDFTSQESPRFEALERRDGENCGEVFKDKESVETSPFELKGWVSSISVCLRDEWGNVLEPEKIEFFYVSWLVWSLVLLAVFLVSVRNFAGKLKGQVAAGSIREETVEGSAPRVIQRHRGVGALLVSYMSRSLVLVLLMLAALSILLGALFGSSGATMLGIGIGLLGVLATLAAWRWPRRGGPDVYALRVQVTDPEGRPVTGSSIKVSSSNEPHLLPDGWWAVEVPAAKLSFGKKVKIWAEHPAWEGGQTELELGKDPNLSTEVRLKQHSSE